MATARCRSLQASKDYQKFYAEAGDLNQWLDDKMKIAGDENYRDLTNLPRKLQKHKAFERELRANEGQLRNINKVGLVFSFIFNIIYSVIHTVIHRNEINGKFNFTTTHKM